MARILFLLTGVLVLPLAALLFAQWPLRDLVQAGAREANDLAQIIFALYMAVAVTAASRSGTHLSAGRADAPRSARWRAWALAACTVPWALFMLWASGAPVLVSVLQLEQFGETQSPGYFIIKLALWLMAALVLVNGLAGLRGRPTNPE